MSKQKKRLIRYRDRLFSKMLILFLSIVVVPALIIGVVASSMFIDILVDKTSSSYATTISNLQDSLENELFETKMSAYYMYLDLDLKEAIAQYSVNMSLSDEARIAFENKFYNYKISPNFSNVNAVKIYGFNGFMMSIGDASALENLDDERIVSSQWYKEALHNPDEFIWTGLLNTFVKQGEDKTISIYRVIKDRSYTEDIGMLYVNLDPQIFASLGDKFSFSEQSQIYILDSNNTTVSSDLAPDDVIALSTAKAKEGRVTLNYSTVVDGEDKSKYFLNYITTYKWKVVGVLPVNEVTRSTVEVFYLVAMIFMVFFIAASFIWLMMMARIFSPIKKLTAATKLVHEGDFSVQVDYESKDELGLLTNNFNFMVTKIKELVQEVVQENNRKKDAEYRALQAQINPHFLYNTLNSIRWMAIIQKADNIKRVVDVLGRLLRNSTSKMDQYITVGEEVDNLKDYVYIQQIAYNNKFQVDYKIGEDVLGCHCLKFILQPLVENAIFHGILPKETYGTIVVDIHRKDQLLEIIVLDDGVGMSNDAAQELLEKEDETLTKLSGIGMNSIYGRLQMAYDGQSHFTIDSKIGESTQIVIQIPYLSTTIDGSLEGEEVC